MEPQARTIEDWSPGLVPGILQTEAYARAVVHSVCPADLPEQVDAKVDARLRRATLFDAPERPERWTIIHESVLRQPLLPPADMAHQLDHITALAERRRIVPQIMLWNASTRPFMNLNLVCMRFPDAPPLVYTEGAYHGLSMDEPELVEPYRRAYERLRATALSPEASLDMIQSAAEDYRNGRQPA
ncbi:DUF5753 domain-containing protein [Streptomyces sp. NPDC055078]